MQGEGKGGLVYTGYVGKKSSAVKILSCAAGGPRDMYIIICVVESEAVKCNVCDGALLCLPRRIWQNFIGLFYEYCGGRFYCPLCYCGRGVMYWWNMGV